MRPIDADDVKKKFQDMLPLPQNDEEKDCYFAVRAMLDDWVDSVPTLNTKIGYWIWEPDSNYAGGGKTSCSICHYPYSDGAFFEVENWDYCPNCGNKMFTKKDWLKFDEMQR